MSTSCSFPRVAKNSKKSSNRTVEDNNSLSGITALKGLSLPRAPCMPILLVRGRRSGHSQRQRVGPNELVPSLIPPSDPPRRTPFPTSRTLFPLVRPRSPPVRSRSPPVQPRSPQFDLIPPSIRPRSPPPIRPCSFPSPTPSPSSPTPFPPSPTPFPPVRPRSPRLRVLTQWIKLMDWH